MLHGIEGSKLGVYGAPAAICSTAAGAPLSYRATEPAIWHGEMHVRLRGLHDSVDIAQPVGWLGVVSGPRIMHVEIFRACDKHGLLGLVIIGSKFLVGKRPVD